MNNPFTFGTASSGDQFTDRVVDTERLLNNFRHNINTILISPRRWGKTSLVQKAANLASNKDLKVVTIDAFYCRTEEEFYMLFATEIIKQTANKWEEWVENAKHFLAGVIPKINFGIESQAEISFSLDFSHKQYNDDVLNLPQRIASEKGFQIVICIDEFQQIAEFDNHLSFQKKLRSVWQLQQNVAYCLYGSRKHLMTELFARPNMPFYKFGDVFFLQKIATSDWVSFICERFLSTGKAISEELAQRICEAVDNHSSYVQQLSWILWTTTGQKATETDLQNALSDLLKQNSALFYRYVEGLSAYQLNFLQAVADGVQSEFTKTIVLNQYNLGTAANVKRLKNSLEKKELIDIDGKMVSMSDPVFTIWFLQTAKRNVE